MSAGPGQLLPVRIGTVTVTHYPDLGILASQLAALPKEIFKIIVDNASPIDIREALEELVTRHQGTLLFTNSNNLGLAAALNQGVTALRSHMPDTNMVLLLDQDSKPEPGSIQRLVECLIDLRAKGHKVGAVGPQLRDADTGLMHGFHQMTCCRWRRVFPSLADATPVSVANLNGSGTLMLVDVFEHMGCLDEALFIDHVDTEWSFRLLANGYSLWGVPTAVFSHRMGQQGISFWWLVWRVWPARSSVRHRYLFRNTLWLMRRSYVPGVWKVWAIAKLLLTAIVLGVFDPERRKQLAAMRAGIRQGLRLRGTAP